MTMRLPRLSKGSGRIAAVVAIVAVATVVIAATLPRTDPHEQAYLEELTVQLEVAGLWLGQAAEAMGECNRDLVACLQRPDDYATPIERSAQGLSEVRVNLTGMSPPDPFVGSHAKLGTGLGEVVDGLLLYAAGLRERDPGKLNDGGSLIQTGKRKIDAATSEIRAQARAGGFGETAILTVAVVTAAASLAILGLLLYPEWVRGRREWVEREWATCPVCGEVLDQHWTYRLWQVKEWRSAHMETHRGARRGRTKAGKGDGRPTRPGEADGSADARGRSGRRARTGRR